MEQFIDESNNPFLADTLVDVPLTPPKDMFETVTRVDGFPLKTLFLTYACPKDGWGDIPSTKANVGLFLYQREPTPTEVMVSEELHENGERHYHCLVQWAMTKKKVNHDFFNFWGVHPNIQVVRNYWAVKEYITKEDKDPYHRVMYIDLDSEDEGYEE